MIFWRKIVIFHTKYPKNFRASLRSAQFFYVRPPLTWNPGSAPGMGPIALLYPGPIMLLRRPWFTMLFFKSPDKAVIVYAKQRWFFTLNWSRRYSWNKRGTYHHKIGTTAVNEINAEIKLWKFTFYNYYCLVLFDTPHFSIHRPKIGFKRLLYDNLLDLSPIIYNV